MSEENQMLDRSIQVNETKGVPLKDVLFVLSQKPNLENKLIAQLLSESGAVWIQPNVGKEDFNFPAPFTMRSAAQTGRDWELYVLLDRVPESGWANDEKQKMLSVYSRGTRFDCTQSVIHQLIELLGLQLDPVRSRWVDLVACGHSGEAFKTIQATDEEISRVWAAVRANDGITQEQEAAAELAVQDKQVRGRLTIVKAPPGPKSAILDRLWFDRAVDQLVIVQGAGPRFAFSYYGDAGIAQALVDRYQGVLGTYHYCRTLGSETVFNVWRPKGDLFEYEVQDAIRTIASLARR